MSYYSFTFGGISTSTYNVFISPNDNFGVPERVVEVQPIPGKNGDVVIDQGRYANKDVTYTCYVRKDMMTDGVNFLDAIKAKHGYQKFTDTVQTDIFRMGYLKGDTDVAVSQMRRSGYFGLVFNFKPQKFLNSGDSFVTVATGDVLTNPTKQTALPILRLYGTGTITIGGVAVTVNTNSSYTDIDCELGDAYYGSTNRNGNITVSNNKFPSLPAGNSTVTFSGFTTVKIKPRWWRL